MTTDIHVEDHGSLIIMSPGSEAGREWCCEWLPEECPQWAGGYAIERRYAAAIIEGMLSDGLVIA